jgi:hypothetical protein
LLTEPIGPPYMELEYLDFEILILNSIELLGCLNHVITITLRIIYTGCYKPLPPAAVRQILSLSLSFSLCKFCFAVFGCLPI